MTAGVDHRPLTSRDVACTPEESPFLAAQNAQVVSPRIRITTAGDARSVNRGRVIVSGGPHVHEGRGARAVEVGLGTAGAVVAGGALVAGGAVRGRVACGLVGFAEAEGAVSASFSGCEVEHAAATETSNATREVTPPVRTE